MTHESTPGNQPELPDDILDAVYVNVVDKWNITHGSQLFHTTDPEDVVRGIAGYTGRSTEEVKALLPQILDSISLAETLFPDPPDQAPPTIGIPPQEEE
jgi:hypothetical protein